MPSTQKTVLILGANGSFGSHAAEAFASKANWTVLAQTRAAKALNPKLSKYPNIIHTPIDIEDENAMASAAEQAGIIVNALNPPYGKWASAVPSITAAVLKAAKHAHATLILPGNVYNYGANMPPLLKANTPHLPTTSRGEIRETLEKLYKAASDEGVKVIILRLGDFLTAEKTGNWFDSQMTDKLAKGRFTYPGDRTIAHAWAYLPDAARAAVQLAEIADELPSFNDIPFAGTTLTGAQMADEIEKALASGVKNKGRKIKTGNVPWPILKFISLFNPDLKGAVEMRYLWDTPHALDGKALQTLLPDFQATSTAEIIKACVARYG